jgi:hypothetical protein
LELEIHDTSAAEAGPAMMKALATANRAAARPIRLDSLITWIPSPLALRNR